LRYPLRTGGTKCLPHVSTHYLDHRNADGVVYARSWDSNERRCARQNNSDLSKLAGLRIDLDRP
jgi:hypothetical protein